MRSRSQPGGNIVVDVDEDRQLFSSGIGQHFKRALIDERDQPKQIHFQRIGKGVLGLFKLSL